MKIKFRNMSIVQHCGHSKYLYKVVSDLTGSKVDNPLPDAKLDNELAEAFATFFVDKIQKTMDNLEKYKKYQPTLQDVRAQFDMFGSVLENTVKRS